jgi:hypothetical protein
LRVAPRLATSSSAAKRWKIEQARDKRDNSGKVGEWERRYFDRCWHALSPMWPAGSVMIVLLLVAN